ncbi:MAG: hypothetical protein LIP11_07205, partial [Clostridiales bacterium]|nr:hypothetical protein [Clostridiales bacterium]
MRNFSQACETLKVCPAAQGMCGRAFEFENAIEWFCLSGIVSQVYKVEQIKPLENYRDIDAFKIYVSD